MICPKCGKVAKTKQGLAKHLRGTTHYGGHNVSAEEAIRLVAQLSASPPDIVSETPPRAMAVIEKRISIEDQEDFFFACLTHVVDNKGLPKYQFERVIDFCLGPFLPHILCQLYRAEVHLVTQEFPLKKPGSFQSTNMDYVLFRSGDKPAWVFLELKTDSRSVSQDQMATYSSLIVGGIQMTHLVEDLRQIQIHSSQPTKYAAHLGRIDSYKDELSAPIELVYLAPVRQELPISPHLYKSLTFDDLSKIDLEKYDEQWDLFKNLALPVLVS